MQENFEIPQTEDVIAFDQIQDKDAKIVTEMLDALRSSYLVRSDDFITSLVNLTKFNDKPKVILKEGIPCRIMTTRKQGWTKGKVKLILQFIPDKNDDVLTSESSEKQPDIVAENNDKSIVLFESPLDEIRNSSIL